MVLIQTGLLFGLAKFFVECVKISVLLVNLFKLVRSGVLLGLVGGRGGHLVCCQQARLQLSCTNTKRIR